jgi:hypothetical protein
VNRKLLVVACVLLVLSLGSVLLGFVMSLQAVSLQHVTFPPAATIHIDQPGAWLLWHVAPAVSEPKGRIDRSTLPNLTRASGERIAISPTIRSIRFAKGGATYEVVGRYDVRTAGNWVLSAKSDTNAAAGSWAVGLDPLPKVKVWSLLTVSVAIVLVGGAACTGWIAFRRGPNNRSHRINPASRG